MRGEIGQGTATNTPGTTLAKKKKTKKASKSNQKTLTPPAKCERMADVGRKHECPLRGSHTLSVVQRGGENTKHANPKGNIVRSPGEGSEYPHQTGVGKSIDQVEKRPRGNEHIKVQYPGHLP